MQYISSSKDVFFPFSGEMKYSIVYQGQQIYEGTAYSNGEGKINVTRRIRDYLETNMPDFRLYESVVVPHPRQMLVFALRGPDGNNLETYTVLQEALGEWSGEYGPITEPVNGHADKRQKLFWDNIGENVTTHWIKGSSESGATPDTGSTPDTGVSGDYLTFDIVSGGTIVWSGTSRDKGINLLYSRDNGVSWEKLLFRDDITVEAGDKILFKSEAPSGIRGASFSGSTAIFDVSGNILSIIYGDNFPGQTVIPGAAFYSMFLGTKVRDAGNLSLPSMSLSNMCYKRLFYNCHHLVSAPVLPATNLADYCYEAMFLGCTSLVYAPLLPATNLAQGCYRTMFWGSHIRSMPELPATTLYPGCYNGMFSHCSSLIYLSELPATTLAEACYLGMFSSCPSITAAPDLNALDVPYAAYELMFADSGVNYIKCMGVSFADRATFQWVGGVGSNGTFVKSATATWTTGIDGIPSGWEVQNA